MLLRNYLKNFKNDFGEQAQIGVYNCLQIIKVARNGDMSGEDFSWLDLSNVPMYGISFSKNNAFSNFDGSIISETTFLPQEHASTVNSITYNPNGDCFLTTSSDGTAKIYSSKTGACIKILSGHTAYVCDANYSLDGAFIVTASDDSTAGLWDNKTGELIRILEGHNGGVISAAYSPNGKFVVTASCDKTARIWEAKRGKLLKTLEGHEHFVNSAVYDPDGKSILTASSDGTVRIWNTDTAESSLVFCDKRDNPNITKACFSPDGKSILVISASFDGVKMYSAETFEIVRTFGNDLDEYFSSIVCCPKSSLVATTSGRTIRIWNSETGELIKKLSCPTGTIAFSPNGEFIASTGFGFISHRSAIPGGDVSYINNIYVWNVMYDKLALKLEGEGSTIVDAAFSPDGKLIVSTSNDGKARIWDSKTGTLVKLLEGHSDRISGVAYCPKGNYVATISDDDTARIWNVETGETVRVINRYYDMFMSVAYSPNGRFLITVSQASLAAGSRVEAIIWEADTGEIAKIFGNHGSLQYPRFQHAAYSPNGRYVFAIGLLGEINIWDSKSGDLIKTMQVDYFLEKAIFSPSGKHIATVHRSYNENILQIWDIITGERVKELVHSDKVLDASCSLDGKFIVTITEERIALIWDTETCTPIKEIKYTEKFRRVLYSPDGKHIMLFGSVCIVLVDIETCRIKKKFHHYHKLNILGCSFANTKFPNDTIKETIRQYGGIIL
jgi:WD40 repeat protein